MVDVLRLHVGLPKCGSTTLQTTFAASETTLYLGRPFPDPDILYFTQRIAPFYDVRMIDGGKYQAAFETVFKETPHAHALLSDEILSSIGFLAHGRGLSVPQIVENFKRVLDVKIEIFIIVREQLRFLKSYFHQSTLAGSDLDFSEFIAMILMRYDRWLYPVLDYELLCRQCRAVADKVTLVPFERLFGDDDYALDLLDQLDVADAKQVFTNTHGNPSPSDPVIAKTIRVNRDIPNGQNKGWFHHFGRSELRHLRREDRDGRFFRLKMQRLLKAQSATMTKWKTALQQTENTPAPDLFSLDRDLEERLMTYIYSVNARLCDRDPGTDWAGLGYRL